MKVTVIGAGYMGTTHAACMAQIGHDVLAVDVDAEKTSRLQNGDLPFFEPELEEIVRENLAGGRLRFTTSYEQAGEFGDVHFLTVGTPQAPGRPDADLTYVDAAIDMLAQHLRRPAIVVGKSTVPVGTGQRLAQRLADTAAVSAGVEVAWNPEFLREGYAVNDTLCPDRIVVGVDNPEESYAAETIRELYRPVLNDSIPFIVTDLATAELVKVSANAFLATKISYINSVAEVCEAAGADITVVADAIGYDVRIGRPFLNAGLGFGGGCLPKDMRAFMARADELGVGDALSLLREGDAVNTRQRSHIVEMARAACGSLRDARIAVLGAAFKPNSDDIRDSPALAVAEQVRLQGANVTVYDPKAMDNARKTFPKMNYAQSVQEACIGADAVLVLTEWDEFRTVAPQEIAAVARRRFIIDARNCLDPKVWRSAGWTYRGFGRP